VGSRWRIRHKLMLGLGLVVGVLALLECGTSYGLWSYYITTNTIRAKLAELDAAREFKDAVAKLVARDRIQDLVKKPDKLEEFPDEVNKTRARLDAYQEQLRDTLEHGRDPGKGVYEQDMIDLLHKDLDRFQREVEERITAPWAGGSVGDENHQNQVVLQLQKKGRDGRPGPITALENDARDLHDHIKEELNTRLAESRRHYQVALWIIIPSSVFGLLLMAGLMRSFYGWVFYPIRDLEAGVGRLARGDFAHRIELHSGDEMEDLATAFNDMTQRLHDLYADLARQVNERSRQLVRSERLASVGFLAAGVAHEINNPLASIAFCSEALEARLDDLLRHLRATGRASEEHDIFAKYLRMIQQEAFRCKNITERLLDFSRSGERKREPTDLRQLLDSVLDMTEHLPSHKGKHIEVLADERRGPPLAWANGEEIKSVVFNLVVNALDSMEEGGTLTIRLGQRDGMAELVFRDSGCGMTQEVLENIFEPFFTRSRSGKGTGLGLTISHRIISQHGGEIEATSPGPDQGSTFTVRLPLQPPLADTGADGPPPAARRPAPGLAA
jgi:signal transduction histidine kinase